MKDHQSTFLSEEPPANPLALPGCDKDSKTLAATSCLHILRSLNVSNLDGLSLKTYPAFCPPTEEKILVPSSGRWATWGMGGPTESWTLSGSEWPNAVAVCSLSDVLETQPVPLKFYLSPRACSGILRRADRRGKALPTTLRHALEQVAGDSSGQAKLEGKIL